jgi:hypothetical protein
MGKNELDALIESTMAFARDINRRPIPERAGDMRPTEQMFVATPEPVEHRTPLPSVMLPMSERDQIRQRVNDFRAHQEKMKRERDDYYSQVKARMMSSAPVPGRNKNPPA